MKKIGMQTLTARTAERRTGGSVERSVRVGNVEVFWRISGPDAALPAKLPRHDIALGAFVFHAMHHGYNLHIDGPVSRSLLERVEDLIACWAAWRPDLYRTIGVSAIEEVADVWPEYPTSNRAVAAFSGGVDSSFTLLRHIRQVTGRRSRSIVSAVLVHGLDIPLGNPEAFEAARISVQDTLDSVGIPLTTISTNWRSGLCIDWEMECGAAIASCLRNWLGTVGTGLLGSDEDYLHLVLPWGTNPITCAMLSSPDFVVAHDGGEFTRSAKVAFLADWERGLQNLRVCWEGAITGKNCGQCEKCLRTKLNFMASGMRLPPSLQGIPDYRQISSIKVRNPIQLSFLVEILDLAMKNGINAHWVKALRRRIIRARCIFAVRSAFSSWRSSLGLTSSQ